MVATALGTGHATRLLPLATVILLWSILGLLVLLPLCLLALWSVADGWISLALLPSHYTWDHWRAVGLDVSLLAALLRSLGISGIVTVLSLLLAIPAAWAMVRSPWRRALEVFVLAPLIVPGLVVAAGVGRLLIDVQLAYSVSAIISVQIVGVLPLAIRALVAAFESLPAEIWWAARSAGAKPWQAMLYIVLPQSHKTLAATALLVAVTSFSEFDCSFIVGAPVTETLPVRLYFLLDGASAAYPAAAVASVMLVLPILLISIVLRTPPDQDVPRNTT